MAASKPELRISLTISGAVSLGAYEGGVLAALLHCLQLLGPDAPVRIDAIGGASAGSITALLSARTLLAGLDPVDVMRRAWVKTPSLRQLERGARRAPFSMDALSKLAAGILNEQGSSARAQPGPVKVHMALATLRGLTYSIPDLLADSSIDATTHLDWGEFTFTSPNTTDFTDPAGDSAVDTALASGANALGFPPYLLNRTAQKPTYERNGVRGVPPDGLIWYTDGGTIDNEPLGRTLDMTNELDGDDTNCRRLHVLIHPHPTTPDAHDPWATGKPPPGEWTRALMRVLQIQRTQTLSEDLRRLQRTNSRLEWRQRFEEWLGKVRSAAPEQDRDRFDAELRELLEGIDADRNHMRGLSQATRLLSPANRTDEDPLTGVLDEITALGGKTPARVSVISPAALAKDEGVSVEELLAGEFLFHFGGFVDEPLRQHDFAVGYESAVRWLRTGGLAGTELEPGNLKKIIDVVADAQPDRPPVVVDTRARLRILRLGARIARIVARDVRRWKPWRSQPRKP
jgi:predicted acylesterase/phospholipase RssA